MTKNILANAFALSTGLLWIGCSVLVALFPEQARIITEWWMHGMTVNPYQISVSNILWGGVTLIIAAWITGYVLGFSIEIVGKKAK